MPTDPEAAAATYRGARVLVTGGAGFIGSHLARRLASLGAEVVVIDDLSSGRAANLAGAGVDLRRASILDEGALRDAVDGCAVVFHQAAMVSVPRSVEDPAGCAEVNIVGTHRVLEAARAARTTRTMRVRRVVFASSAAVYGDEPRLPSRESDPIDCRSPYAASKVAGEALLAAFGRCYPISTVSLRYFNVFGPRQDPRSPYAAAIAAFHDAVASGRRPRVFGDGAQTRDFVPVANVVHANLLAGAAPRDLRGEAMNVGTGVRTRLLEVLERLAALAGVEADPSHEPSRPGDVRHSAADVARARELIGYEPTVTLEQGLAELMASGAR